MARTKKRSRALAAPTLSVPSHQTIKKKTKLGLSKTLSVDAKTNAAALNASKTKDDKKTSPVEPVVDKSSVKGAENRKKKRKRSGNNAKNDGATKKEAMPEVNGREIDNLFASLKTKKMDKSFAREQQKIAEEEKERQEKKEREQLQQQIKKLEAQNTNSTAAGLNPDPRPARYDEDGLPIYTEAALQIGKGGNTKDCPFDCWCCF